VSGWGVAVRKKKEKRKTRRKEKGGSWSSRWSRRGRKNAPLTTIPVLLDPCKRRKGGSKSTA